MDLPPQPTTSPVYSVPIIVDGLTIVHYSPMEPFHMKSSKPKSQTRGRSKVLAGRIEKQEMFANRQLKMTMHTFRGLLRTLRFLDLLDGSTYSFGNDCISVIDRDAVLSSRGSSASSGSASSGPKYMGREVLPTAPKRQLGQDIDPHSEVCWIRAIIRTELGVLGSARLRLQCQKAVG